MLTFAGGGGPIMSYPKPGTTGSPYIGAGTGGGAWNSTPSYIGANWNYWQNYQPTATTPASTGPDPGSWVESILGPLRQELAGQSAQDMASAKAGIKRALISGGFDFDAKAVRKALGFGDIPKGIFDERTHQLIQEGNTAGLTQNFRINQANDDARRAIVNNLAARGIIRGGSTGFQLGRQNTAYTQAQYGARQHILDTIAGIWGQYLQAERQRAMMLAQAGLSAGGGG